MNARKPVGTFQIEWDGRDDAKDRVERHDFEHAKSINTVASYEQFLTEYQTKRCVLRGEAQQLLTEARHRAFDELSVKLDSVSVVDINSAIFHDYTLSDFLRVFASENARVQVRALEYLDDLVTQDSTVILDILDYLVAADSQASQGAQITLDRMENLRAINALFTNISQYQGRQLEFAIAYLNRNRAP